MHRHTAKHVNRNTCNAHDYIQRNEQIHTLAHICSVCGLRASTNSVFWNTNGIMGSERYYGHCDKELGMGRYYHKDGVGSVL